MKWLLPTLLVACSGETGTIQLELVTAPGSAVLDGVDRLRVTLTDPLTIVDAPRTASGFDVTLDVEATGTAGTLIVEGFDASDAVIATGESPPFAVSAISARIVIYIAAPLTIALAPTRLPAERIGVASTPLTFGFALAGGEATDGTRSDSIFIYNAFDHSLLAGKEMPAPRTFQTLATGSNNTIYLFGGLGSDGAPTGSLWRFDTNVPPNGSYALQPDQVDLARAGAMAVAIEPERFVITGTPPIDLTFGTATARTDVPTLLAGAGIVIDGVPTAVFGGEPILRLRDNTIEELRFGTEPDVVAAAVGDSFVVFPSFRGTTEIAFVSARTLDDPGMFLDLQSTVRRRPAVAATSRHLVVAGGTDDAGVAIPSADIIDLATLALVTTVPCFARAGATAHAMPNNQIAIVGGEPANDLIELFTPPSPGLD
ncbi:MAG: hypothetical protein H0V17_01435 [Deltaproteobacteria bacterium]|nr:hypothetical protein [Deltaproteobacteria bacterium]